MQPIGIRRTNTIREQTNGFMHANYFLILLIIIFIGMPIDDDRSIGVSLIRFGVDDILDTTQLIDENGNINYDRIVDFQYRLRHNHVLC